MLFIFKEMFTSMVKEKSACKIRALEHYGKFLDLWKNADPGIAEVEDARKRQAGLKRDHKSKKRGGY